MGTEIHTFYSLKEITDYVTDQINQYKVIFEDYSQWLGSLLRSYEETHGNEDWFQNLAALHKASKANPAKTKPKKGKRKEKSKKAAESSLWVHFSELLLCASDQGEAEILFEATDKINKKLESLETIKDTIEQLEGIGLGGNINYMTYIRDDVPERIVFRSRADKQFDEKFKFAADFMVPGSQRE